MKKTGRRLAPGMLCAVFRRPALVVAMDDDVSDTWVKVLVSGSAKIIYVAPSELLPLAQRRSSRL